MNNPRTTRSLIQDVRWGARIVKMRSDDHGDTYMGDAGKQGLILVARRGPGGYVLRLEDRKSGNSWASSEPKFNLNVCAAALRRDIMRLIEVVAPEAV